MAAHLALPLRSGHSGLSLLADECPGGICQSPNVLGGAVQLINAGANNRGPCWKGQGHVSTDVFHDAARFQAQILDKLEVDHSWGVVRHAAHIAAVAIEVETQLLPAGWP